LSYSELFEALGKDEDNPVQVLVLSSLTHLTIRDVDDGISVMEVLGSTLRWRRTQGLPSLAIDMEIYEFGEDNNEEETFAEFIREINREGVDVFFWVIVYSRSGPGPMVEKYMCVVTVWFLMLCLFVCTTVGCQVDFLRVDLTRRRRPPSHNRDGVGI
jgi:hypothetical protein